MSAALLHWRTIVVAIAVVAAVYGAVWLIANAYGLVREEPCKVKWMASSTDQSGRTHTTSNCDPR